MSLEKILIGLTKSIDTLTEAVDALTFDPRSYIENMLEKAKTEPEAKEEPTAEPNQTVTRLDIRKVGGAIMDMEKPNETTQRKRFLALLNDEFNAKDITKLSEDQFPACLAAMEEILGKKLGDIKD